MKLNYNQELIDIAVFCTVKIKSEWSASDTAYIAEGTGFLYTDERNGISLIYIITNVHLIYDLDTPDYKGLGYCDELSFSISFCGNDGNPIHGEYKTFKINKAEDKINVHPAGLDLCKIEITDLINEYQNSNQIRPVYLNPVESSDIFSDSDYLSFHEKVIMIGYPDGIWDDVNNLPIIRTGYTATHPKINFQGKDEFLIDIACFNGSSGSPVFLYDRGNYKSNVKTTNVGDRLILLGILWGGPVTTLTGKLEKPVMKRREKIPIIDFSINLGYIINAQKILDI